MTEKKEFSMPEFDSPKNWVEDYKDGHNQYICKCVKCKESFYGYKRRIVCKECESRAIQSKKITKSEVKELISLSDEFDNLIQSKEPQAKHPKCSHFDCDCKPQAEEEGAKEYFNKYYDDYIIQTVVDINDLVSLYALMDEYASHKLTAVKKMIEDEISERETWRKTAHNHPHFGAEIKVLSELLKQIK